jgi:hypothetical protein
LGNRLAALAIDISDYHLGSFFGKPARIGFANAVGGAGNDDDFALQSHGLAVVKIKFRSCKPSEFS